MFRNYTSFYSEELSAPHPTPKPGGPPPVRSARLFIQYIRSYPPYCRPSLHPQPEDAPYHGDMDLSITAILTTQSYNASMVAKR